MIRATYWILHRLPVRRLSRIGSACCTLLYVAFPKARKRTLANLSFVFGGTRTPEEIRDIARASYRNCGTALGECIAYSVMSADERRAFVRVKGLDRLRDALAEERGVIAISAHFGNFLILAGKLSTEGIPVNLVVNQMKDPKTERLFNEMRASAGIRTIPLYPTRSCARACLKVLKRNEVLVLFIDQNYRPRRGGVAVDFFGRRAFTAPGAASLALACGSPVLPMFMFRDKDGGNTLVIDPPAPVIRSGGKKAEDVVANIQGFTKIIERRVAENPDLWTWMYRRWR